MAFLLGGYNGINNICNMMQKKAELLRDGHSVTYQGLYGSAQQDPPPPILHLLPSVGGRPNWCDFYGVTLLYLYKL